MLLTHYLPIIDGAWDPKSAVLPLRFPLTELETHILVASAVGYLTGNQLLERIANIEHMLNALISVVARKLRKEY